MTFEEFETAKPEDLREVAKECFEKAHKLGESWGGAPTLLLETQFYMTEIDRRNESNIARRDFRLELAIIGLILLELVVAVIGIVIGVREGNEQAKILEGLRAGIQATYQSMQAEHELNYRVSLNVVPHAETESLAVFNTGQRNVSLVGRKLNDRPPDLTSGWAIIAGQSANVTVANLFDNLLAGTRTGHQSSATMQFYLRADDGVEWIATYQFTGTPGAFEVSTKLTELVKRQWSRNSPR
jgi:hypothetical protein